MGTKFSAFTDASSFAATDEVVGLYGGANGRWTRKELLQGTGTAANGDILRYNTAISTPTYETVNPRWRALSTGTTSGIEGYTAAVPSTSTITVTDSVVSAAPAGTPIRYNVGSGSLYGIVTAASGTTLTISGPSLSASLTALAIGTPEMVDYITLPVHTAGTIAEIAAGTPATSLGYAPTVNTALVTNHKWLGPPAYCVNFSMSASTVYSTVKPKINVRVNGTVISNMDSSAGVTITAASTWYEPTAATITSAYAVTYGQTVDLYCTLAGTGTPGMNLSAVLVFVKA